MPGLSYVVGVKTRDRVIIAADKRLFAHGAMVISEDDDKMFPLGERTVMACVGEEGDVPQFGEWAQKNIDLYRMRHGYELSPASTAHWIRKAIADNLRSAEAYMVDSVIGGYSTHDDAAYLAIVDYLGGKVDTIDYVFRGFGGNFCYSIMDSAFRRDMTEVELLDLIQRCLSEVKKRFIANLPAFQICVIDGAGIRRLPDLVV